MKATILWSQRARRDLLEIGDFIARDKPEAAERWVGRVVDAVERTALFPTSGRIVPEVDREDVREVILDNYRVVYVVGNHQIVVVTVFESHRLLIDSDINGSTSS